MSTGDATYQPKVGDRVRATRIVEGTVTLIQEETKRYDSYVGLDLADGDGGQDDRIELFGDDGWSFEKLQDPELAWVNGDVVRVPGDREGETLTCFRIPGKWYGHDGGLVRGGWVSEMWTEGNLEILYKADAA